MEDASLENDVSRFLLQGAMANPGQGGNVQTGAPDAMDMASAGHQGEIHFDNYLWRIEPCLHIERARRFLVLKR